MDEYRIMIVDDEPDILDLIEKALNIEGYYNIIKISNGFSAVKACKETKPDIIILDVMLPDIDGYKVCKQIREFSFVQFYSFPPKMMSLIRYLVLLLEETIM